MIELSIIIPVYRSTESLKILSQELQSVLTETGKLFEIIFVNDSPGFPSTAAVLSEIQSENRQPIKVATMRRNRGQHFATLVGISLASGRFIVTMDDDLQHSPKEIQKLIDCIESDPDLDAVFAIPSRNLRQHRTFRNLGSGMLSKIDHFFLHLPMDLTKSSFRIIRREISEIMLKHYNASPAVSDLLLKWTHRIKNVEVEYHEREFGKSQYKLHRLFDLTFNNIVYRSSFPLKFLGLLGAFCILGSLFAIFAVIILKFGFAISIPVSILISILILLLGGLNLSGIGIIGEYLIRIIKEQNKADLGELFIES